MSVEETLKDRDGKYGDYRITAAASQELKRVVYKWLTAKPTLPCDTTLESLDNILLKIARIITGDHDYPDNFHDIGGYAKLAEMELLKPKDKQPPIDNDHVAEGCEKFDQATIDANAKSFV